MKGQLNYFISRYQGACLSLWQEQIPINKHDIKNQSVACDSCDRQFPTEIFPHARKNLEACAPNTMRSRTEVSADIFRTSLRNMIEHDELISCLMGLSMRCVKKKIWKTGGLLRQSDVLRACATLNGACSPTLDHWLCAWLLRCYTVVRGQQFSSVPLIPGAYFKHQVIALKLIYGPSGAL